MKCKIHDEEFLKIVNESLSIADCLRKMNNKKQNHKRKIITVQMFN